jgi:hypothetical protein
VLNFSQSLSKRSLLACSYADNTLYTCCKEKNRNITLTDAGDNYLPPEAGNITILYDIVQAYEQNYMAMVSNSSTLSTYSKFFLLINAKLLEILSLITFWWLAS